MKDTGAYNLLVNGKPILLWGCPRAEYASGVYSKKSF
jgi:hypothetical protein